MTAKTSSLRGGLVIVISLLALCLMVAAPAAAQSTKGSTEEQVKVVGHLSLPGIHVNQMFVQREGNRYYLYLHRPRKRAFALVDVSKPDKPVLVEKATLQEPQRERVEVSESSPSLAIAIVPEDSSGAAVTQTNATPAPAPMNLPTETIKVLDLTDPKHPRTLKTFSGVTSMLPDDSRNLLYLVNNEGLWVVRHRQLRPMPFCTSEDALTFEPNCQ